MVHPLDDADLEQQPEEAGDEEGHRQRDHDRDVAGGDHLLGEVGDEGADHEELAVRHVDHAHLAEGEREAERREQQDAHPSRCRSGSGGMSASTCCRSLCGEEFWRRFWSVGSPCSVGTAPHAQWAISPRRLREHRGRRRGPPVVALEERIGLDRSRRSDQTMSNWLSALIWPISPVLAMWWFSPLTVTDALRRVEVIRRPSGVHRVDVRTTRPSRPCPCRGTARCTPPPSGPTSAAAAGYLAWKASMNVGFVRALDALEVVPGGVLTGDLVTHGRRLFLGDRHRDDRRVVRRRGRPRSRP